MQLIFTKPVKFSPTPIEIHVNPIEQYQLSGFLDSLVGSRSGLILLLFGPAAATFWSVSRVLVTLALVLGSRCIHPIFIIHVLVFALSWCSLGSALVGRTRRRFFRSGLVI